MADTERPSNAAARLLNSLRADRYIARNFADELFQLGSLIDAQDRTIALSHAAGQEVDGWLEDWSMPGHRITRASVGPQPDPFPPKVGMTCTGTRPLYLAPAVARSEGEE